jgi:hypothetical protein
MQHLKFAAAWACVVGVCIQASACQPSASTNITRQASAAWSVNLRPCLETAGAKIAASSNDLEFARKDARTLSITTARSLHAGDSTIYELMPEKTSSGNYRLFVEALNRDNAPSISTADVLSHPHTVQLVAYLRDPSVASLTAAESCLGDTG